MADTVTIDGKEWSFEGLPRHYYEHLPVTVELEVEQRRPVTDPTVESMLLGYVPTKETHRVVLERDGEPITYGDRRGWRAGEREGWRAWPVRQPDQDGDEIVLVDVDEEAVH